MFQDARHSQIIALVTFLILGVAQRDWTLDPPGVLLLGLACLLTQAALSRQPPQSPAGKSALITALGLTVLLRSESWFGLPVAGCLGIGSKFWLRVRGKHLFNPANFGIIAATLLGLPVWVSPGQWGEEIWTALVFLGLGGMVLRQVGRWETSGVFMGAYGLLEMGRNLWLGWSWDVLAHRLMSGSLLVFALFMISDPRSIPDARWARAGWAAAVAVLTFVLRNNFALSTAPFWALFLLAPLTPLLDYLWPQERFTWTDPSPENPNP